MAWIEMPRKNIPLYTLCKKKCIWFWRIVPLQRLYIILQSKAKYIRHNTILLSRLNRVYTPCARMGRQPAQMSKLASACASPLHNVSCAVYKSINTRAYASVYVRIRSYAEQRVGPRWPRGAFVIGWNASAGLHWPKKFNMFELWRRQSAYSCVCAGRNWWQKYKQLRRQSAYARAYTHAWSINPALSRVVYFETHAASRNI